MESDARSAWAFLTNHARVLLGLAVNPGVRVPDPLPPAQKVGDLLAILTE
jgi:hypothetical protein